MDNKNKTIPSQKKASNSILWDLFCIGSLIGIWPRFIEPKIIKTSRIQLNYSEKKEKETSRSVSSLVYVNPSNSNRLFPSLNSLEGVKIVQITDLHFNQDLSDCFLDRLIKKITNLSPDLIVITGDFLCFSQLIDPLRLENFLNRLKAPYGCYAVLGNHDYQNRVSLNKQGDYDISDIPSSSLKLAFLRLLQNCTLTKKVTDRAKKIPLNESLIDLLKKTSIKLLHNQTDLIAVKETKINLSGLGEYTLGRMDPEKAFSNLNPNYLHILLLHNPDGAPYLENYPIDIILSGHTHGGQVNLPGFWKKFTLLENIRFKKGIIKLQNGWLYVNRGIGSILPFRFFAPPEIVLLTLKHEIVS